MSERINFIQAGTKPELAEIKRKILAERGRISPLYQVLLNAPEIAQGWEALLTAVRNRNSLSPIVREMIILRFAVLNRAQYEFETHKPHAIKAGMSEEKIEALKELSLSPIFNDEEKEILLLTDVMTKDIQVPDDIFAPIKNRYNDQEILELVTTISAYNMVSRLLNALQIGH